MALRGDRDAIDEALGSIRDGMAVDNYRLTVDEVSQVRLRLRVEALEGACEECLAPPLVLKMMVSGDLDRAYEPEEIEVALPAFVGH